MLINVTGITTEGIGFFSKACSQIAEIFIIESFNKRFEYYHTPPFSPHLLHKKEEERKRAINILLKMRDCRFGSFVLYFHLGENYGRKS